MSSMGKVLLTQKKMLKTMLGISSKSSCRKSFKKLTILPIPKLYIYSLMLFVVDNMHYCQTNACIHEINTRNYNQLCRLPVALSAIQRGATYSIIKIFNKLPPRISGLKTDHIVHKSTFRMFSIQ